MDIFPPSHSETGKTLAVTTSDLFFSACGSFFRQFPDVTPSTSYTLLSQNTPLPPPPSDFPIARLIPKTRFVIDGFRTAGNFSISYFLSHFHADHYSGLNPTWSKGLIFCSETTARLLVDSLGVSNHFVFSLPTGKTVEIDGCKVTLVDANHCPGAVQFLFRVPVKGSRDEKYVHTGDFRYCESMKLDTALHQFVGCDAVFLDTTYCNPKFCFPSQEESIDYIAKTINRIKSDSEGLPTPVLFLVATYVIGKERILLEIARKCNCLVHVNSKKMAILRMIGYGGAEIFTEDASSSNVHVIGWNMLGETWPYFRPNFVKMNEITAERGYVKAVGFVPTGWSYAAKKDGFDVRAKGSFEIHLVPYSEHSSYPELREYVRFLRPKQVVPTVGSDIDKLDSKNVIAMQKHFASLVDETANKLDFLTGFFRGPVYTGGRDEESIEIESGKEKQAEEERSLHLEYLGSIPSFDRGVVSNPRGEENAEEISAVSTDIDMRLALPKLQDHLPIWVIQDQLVDLLRRSGGDVSMAVSDFYDRETELYEQVKAQKEDAASSYQGVSVSPSAPDVMFAKDIPPCEGMSSQERTTSKVFPIKSTSRSNKRVSKRDNKSNKKQRVTSHLDSCGSNQSRITRFFGKVVSSASQAAGPCSSTDTECLGHQSSSSGGVDESYKEELDHFIKITNGSLSRNHATLILEKTNGDVNLALDLYYSNSDNLIPNADERLMSQTASVHMQGNTNSSTEKASSISKESGNIGIPSVRDCNLQDSNESFVSLPIEKYSPVDHACWRAGQPAPYLHLARTFDLVERERGKIKATAMLCNMFRSLLALSPEDVLPAMYLCTNKIAADHENMELNIGGSLVSNALEEACGTNKSKMRAMYNNLGDLGDVAQVCRQTQSLLTLPRPLLVKDLFCALRKISSEVGSGSMTRKKSLIVNLMRSCREMEMKFLVRTLVCNMRIGAMMRTVLPALAHAVVLNSSTQFLLEGTSESLKPLLQSISATVVEAYNILPNLDLLVPSLLSNGTKFSSTTLSMTPGIPIKPMLARITNGIVQALKSFEGRAFTCEYKYDGQRAQIHRLENGCIQIFSRSGEDATSKFPDVVSIIKNSCGSTCKTFILDAEVVAVDRKSGNRLMSFQQLSSRERGGRGTSVALDNIKVDICVFIFDIMLAGGEQLLVSPLRQRRKYLKDLFPEEKPGYLEFAEEITVEADEAWLVDEATVSKINSFLESAFNSSCEGIMVKSLDVDAGYAASKRSSTWLKVKRDYLDGLNDTLDLVPIGAWHGNGRKAGWYSPYLLACHNPDTEEFESVCRVMSGFSDSFYTEMKELFSGGKILSGKPPYYRTAEVPDVWFSPELVWEIKGADFSISPVHKAAVGLVHPSKGISIRFPRFIRSVEDREPEDCSTSSDIADMFQSQTRKMDVSIED